MILNIIFSHLKKLLVKDRKNDSIGLGYPAPNPGRNCDASAVSRLGLKHKKGFGEKALKWGKKSPD
jgi:hypothetical protein